MRLLRMLFGFFRTQNVDDVRFGHDVTYLLREGDEVEVVTSETESGWGNNPRQRGDRGTVIGFAEQFQSRYRTINKPPPGIYPNPYQPLVDFAGQVQPISTHYLRMVDQQEYDRRRMESSNPARTYLDKEEGHLLRELPDTEFWEDDLVRHESAHGIWRVTAIEYGHPRSRGAYTLCKIDAGETRHAAAGELVLHRRGNFWRPAHGQALEFENPLEEADFYHRTNRTTELKPFERPSDHSILRALNKIRNGEADFFLISHLAFSSITCYKFNDPEVGNRVRPAFLEQWKNWKPEKDL